MSFKLYVRINAEGAENDPSLHLEEARERFRKLKMETSGSLLALWQWFRDESLWNLTAFT